MYQQQLFQTWVSSLIKFSASPNEYIQWVKDEIDEDEYIGWAKVYTRNHSYSITCRAKDGQPGYLGCIVSARKPLAGETHTRGNDLADGHFNVKTWHKIVLDIVRYELVKVVHSVRRKQ